VRSAVIMFVASLCMTAVSAAAAVTGQENVSSAAAKSREVSDLIRVDLQGESLKIELAPGVAPKGSGELIKVTGSSARWQVRTTQDASGVDVAELTYEDTVNSQRNGHCKAVLTCARDYVSIAASLRCDGDLLRVTYHAWSEPGTAQLAVHMDEGSDGPQMLFNAHGGTLMEMWNESPEQVEKYLLPVLKKLARKNPLGPGATDVYQVFTSIKPEAASMERLNAILPGLEDLDPPARQAASRALEKLARGEALAAMRLDRSDLTPEQDVRLGQFIEQHRRRWRRPAESAMRDVRFLMECLEDEDAQVRSAAKETLETAMGHSIDFDPLADFDTRLDSVEDLRQHLGGSSGFAGLEQQP
jgi:hypothetical protein